MSEIALATADLAPEATGILICDRVTDWVPARQFGEFVNLPISEQRNVLLHLKLFRRLEEAGPGRIGKAAVQLSREVRTMHPNIRGMSPGRIRAKYKLWKKGGRKTDENGKETGEVFHPNDWRCLVRQYTNGGDEHPREFIEYLVTLYSETTRNNDAFAGVHARLKREWFADEPIPGYGRASEWYPKQGLPVPSGKIQRDADLPPSWSYSTLWRHLKKALPSRAMRQAAQGQTNRLRTSWGEQMIRDRSKLLPMQLITIDDVRLDLQVRMFVDNAWQIVYVDAIFALDVATGRILAFGIKGRALRSKDTEKGKAENTRMSINGADVRHLFLKVLTDCGLPPWKMKWLMEMAAARLNQPDEEAFLQLMGDRLETDYTGMGRSKLLESGFHEEWGRPGMKGWIESFFRILHTHSNHLEGTTGRRFDLTRGDQPARVKYSTSLIARAEKIIDGPLSPDQPLAKQLSFPVLALDEANHVVGEIVEALNWRVKHKLQGFERIFEWKDSSGHWHSQDDLNSIPAEERVGIKLTPRQEAPAERFIRLGKPYASQWQRVDPEVLYALYAEKRPATLREGNITISDQKLSREAMIFGPADLEQSVSHDGVKEGVLAYLSDDLTHCVIACRKSGAYLATLPRKGTVDITDETAIAKRAGEVHRWQEEQLDHIRSLLPEQQKHFAERLDNNEDTLRLAAETRDDVPGKFTQAREAEKREKKREATIRRASRSNPDSDKFDSSRLLSKASEPQDDEPLEDVEDRFSPERLLKQNTN
ncbi:MAG: hypothetical protein AAGJ81_01540 [Verrucomicrobiota bacterium]